MILIQIVLLIIATETLAKPIFYDWSDVDSDELLLINDGDEKPMSNINSASQEASTSDNQGNLASAPSSFTVADPVVETDSSNSYCPYDRFSNLDAQIDNLHARNVFPRQSCSTGLKTPTRPLEVNKPSHHHDTKEEQNPCPDQPNSLRPKRIHVTCGGPSVGESFTEPDIVINCVPGRFPDSLSVQC